MMYVGFVRLTAQAGGQEIGIHETEPTKTKREAKRKAKDLGRRIEHLYSPYTNMNYGIRPL